MTEQTRLARAKLEAAAHACRCAIKALDKGDLWQAGEEVTELSVLAERAIRLIEQARHAETELEMQP